MSESFLSEYEARVVREIAAWKAEDAGLFNKLTSTLTMPVAWTLQHVIPAAAARSALETAYATSDWLASPADLLQRAGVASISELQQKELKLCDSLANHVSHGSQAAAAIDGAVTGAGGILLAAADVGALGVLALRAIQRMGHCYGQALDQPRDRAYVMGVLLVAATKSNTERMAYLDQLQDVERWFLAETVEAIAIERLTLQLIEIASLEAVPGIGAVIGTGANLHFIGHVLEAARRVFQERWLRGNNKVASIEPHKAEPKPFQRKRHADP